MNYLEEIEAEYSRIRGKYSPLSPVDWDLANNWLKKDIPLNIVQRAMIAVGQNFEAKKHKRPINTLRYFENEVEAQYAEYLEMHVGKNNFEENNMNQSAYAVSTETDVLEFFIEKLGGCQNPPELLRAAIAKAKGEILALRDDVTQKHLSSDAVESRLAELRAELEISLILSIPEDDRALLVRETQTEYGKFHITDELLQKVLIRKLYQKFDLPELTLYAL